MWTPEPAPGGHRGLLGTSQVCSIMQPPAQRGPVSSGPQAAPPSSLLGLVVLASCAAPCFLFQCYKVSCLEIDQCPLTDNKIRCFSQFATCIDKISWESWYCSLILFYDIRYTSHKSYRYCVATEDYVIELSLAKSITSQTKIPCSVRWWWLKDMYLEVSNSSVQKCYQICSFLFL